MRPGRGRHCIARALYRAPFAHHQLFGYNQWTTAARIGSPHPVLFYWMAIVACTQSSESRLWCILAIDGAL